MLVVHNCHKGAVMDAGCSLAYLANKISSTPGWMSNFEQFGPSHN